MRIRCTPSITAERGDERRCNLIKMKDNAAKVSKMKRKRPLLLASLMFQLVALLAGYDDGDGHEVSLLVYGQPIVGFIEKPLEQTPYDSFQNITIGAYTNVSYKVMACDPRLVQVDDMLMRR